MKFSRSSNHLGSFASDPSFGTAGNTYWNTALTALKIYNGTSWGLFSSGGGGGDLELGETNTTAYRGDRGKTAYDHSQVAHDKTLVGLGNVDNTSDVNKPISTLQQAGLDLKANIASPTFTGTVGGITKSMVGLGSVDNTSDADKPVSTATQTALNLKANLASPALTTPSIIGAISFPDGIRQTFNPDGTNSGLNVGAHTADPSAPSNGDIFYNSTGNALKAYINGSWVALGAGGGGGTWGSITGTLSSQTDLQSALDLKAPIASPTFTGTVGGITKSMVGLGSVDNTADADKPVSTATQTALNLKANLISPSFTTPTLGVASATSVNKVAFTAPATGATITIADGKTLTVSNSLVFTGTDSSSVNFGAGGTVDYLGTAQTYSAKKTFTPTVSVAGINVGAYAGDPSTPVNGDLHYNSTSNALRAYINGAFVSLGAGGGSSYDESNPINDSSTNELMQFYKTTTAVNHVGITNAATGGAPIVSAVGSDTNINLNLQWKGTGFVDLGANPATGTSRVFLRYRESSVVMFQAESTTAASNATRLTVGYSNGIIETGNGTGQIQIATGNYISSGLWAKDGVEIGNATTHYWYPTSVRSIFDVKPASITNYENGTDGSVSRFRVTQFDGNVGGRTLTNSATVQIDGAPTGTANITITNKYALWVKGGVSKFDGTIRPASMADGSASNDSIYYSTTASRLVYKDSGGTVNNLY